MAQTKEAKRVAAIARNEKHRKNYEHQAKEAGLKGEAAQRYVDVKVGIPKPKKVVQLEAPAKA